MSFAEKIAGLMARPNQPDAMQSDVPWYVQYGGRALGIVGAFFCLIFGLYNCLGIILFNVSCLISGILQMLVGFVVMAIEAPCCFFCIEHVNKAVEKVEQRPMWNRAAFYCVIALPPVILCPGLASLFACGMIFGTGAIYGMMSLGKKASREEMAAAATSPSSQMPNNGQMQMGTDQHITLMEDPDVWRPT